jgi:hypothetical protein
MNRDKTIRERRLGRGLGASSHLQSAYACWYAGGVYAIEVLPGRCFSVAQAFHAWVRNAARKENVRNRSSARL